MLKMFNKETEYALRSLVYIQIQNFKGRRPGIIEIAKEIEAPQFFTAKILQRLVKNGFVQSLKGKGGGFYFDENKAELTMRELIITTEGDKMFTGCGFGLKHCDEQNPCPMHVRYAPIRKTINELMQSETIQSLARKEDVKLKSLTSKE
jgi:Rrf2 family protein